MNTSESPKMPGIYGKLKQTPYKCTSDCSCAGTQPISANSERTIFDQVYNNTYVPRLNISEKYRPKYWSK
jgi:hypothetical protein